MIAVMLDLETCGTKTDAVILTFGAVKFNPYSSDEPGPGLYFRVDVNEQIEIGRKIDQDTLDWWATQDPAVRDEAFAEDERISLSEFIKNLNRFVVAADEIFAHGPVFDIPILESLYKALGIPVPWHYWQIRDSRTLLSLKPELRIVDNSAHNALVDAYTQAKTVQSIYKHFGLHTSKV